ncbi:MAG TPA: DUF1614 domain-containing protein [Candidatus Paceibacterota bacterium]
MAVVFVIILLLLAVPFLLVLGFFSVVADSFKSFGVAPGVAAAILVGMLIGSFVNIPIGRHRVVEAEERRFFGLVRRRVMQAQGLSINLGGAVIPVALAIYLLTKVPLQETLLASLLMVVICFFMARVAPGKGITLPVLFPALFALVFALVLAHEIAAPVAFIAGVFGVIVGADLLRLPKVMRDNQGVLSIGGAGVFDGIFLIAIIAAFLAGL